MLIRVLEIPSSSGEFHFKGPEPQTFLEVDWFQDENPMSDGKMMDTEEGRAQIAEFIKGKNYFNPNKAYIVLHQEHTFTVGYIAP